MTNDLKTFLSEQKNKRFAMESGTAMHLKMQKIIIDSETITGDGELVSRIKSNSELIRFFVPAARTEVPIAGNINNRFISRRIDRMIVNDVEKSVIFMDYKTDQTPDLFREKYNIQMREYAQLLRDIYPDYSVQGFILWLHNFELEKIC